MEKNANNAQGSNLAKGLIRVPPKVQSAAAKRTRPNKAPDSWQMILSCLPLRIEWNRSQSTKCKEKNKEM